MPRRDDGEDDRRIGGERREELRQSLMLFFTGFSRFASEFAQSQIDNIDQPRMLRCRYIDQADLLAGDWLNAVESLLAQEEPGPPMRVDGATVAAAAILSLIPSRR